MFGRPTSPLVARLLGVANVNHGVVSASGSIDASGTQVDTTAPLPSPGTAVLWRVTPEDVLLRATGHLTGVITDIADLGIAVEYIVRVNADLELKSRATEPLALRIGDVCRIELAPSAVSVGLSSRHPMKAGRQCGVASQGFRYRRWSP